MERFLHSSPARRALLALFLGVAVYAHAAERVTLRNGFTYDCFREQPLDATHTRLFLLADPSANAPTNYIDLPASEIAGIESLPDPPPASGPPHLANALADDVHSLLSHAGAAHNIDVELLASIVHTESGGHAAAISRAGAQGLMQLMPGTAQALGVADALRPEQNIAGGTAYLDALLTRYKDNLALALAAYNAGPGAVDRYHGIPPFRETRAYVARVMTEFKRRKLALAASSHLPH